MPSIFCKHIFYVQFLYQLIFQKKIIAASTNIFAVAGMPLRTDKKLTSAKAVAAVSKTLTSLLPIFLLISVHESLLSARLIS